MEEVSWDKTTSTTQRDKTMKVVDENNTSTYRLLKRVCVERVAA